MKTICLLLISLFLFSCEIKPKQEPPIISFVPYSGNVATILEKDIHTKKRVKYCFKIRAKNHDFWTITNETDYNKYNQDDTLRNFILTFHKNDK